MSKILCEARAVVYCLSEGWRGGRAGVSRWSFDGRRDGPCHFRNWRDCYSWRNLMRFIPWVRKPLFIADFHAIAVG
jgi:hypothetical protein